MSTRIVPDRQTNSLIDLIAAAHIRQTAREAYWRACQEEQQGQEHARRIGDLRIYIGYNFGRAAEQALNLRYEWSESDNTPTASFDHAGQTYTISLSNQVWYLGRPGHLRCYGDAGGINNRDQQIEHVQTRYDRLLIQIGRALDLTSADEQPHTEDLPF
jgi:hypothetical protein